MNEKVHDQCQIINLSKTKKKWHFQLDLSSTDKACIIYVFVGTADKYLQIQNTTTLI